MTKVLLAEDDEFSRDMLTRRLQKNGYEVVAVADGREAVAQSLHYRPDVVLLDLDMPVMNGRSAMRLLKNDVRTYRIPIIVLTAHTTPDDVAAALAAGCFSYEAKPIVLRRLIERIEEAVLASARKKPFTGGPAAAEGPAPAAGQAAAAGPAPNAGPTPNAGQAAAAGVPPAGPTPADHPPAVDPPAG